MKTFRFVSLLVLCCVLVFPVVVQAQAAKPPVAAPAEPAKPTPPPALSELQKLQVVDALKDIQLWTLREEQAAVYKEKAQKALSDLLTKVVPAGFELDSNLNLVPKAPEKR